MAAPPTFDLAYMKTRMQKSIASLRDELQGLRTGRASASLLEPVECACDEQQCHKHKQLAYLRHAGAHIGRAHDREKRADKEQSKWPCDRREPQRQPADEQQESACSQ